MDEKVKEIERRLQPESYYQKLDMIEGMRYLLSRIKELEEILKRFQDEHCDAVNALGIHWKADDSLHVAVERLVKRSEKMLREKIINSILEEANELKW